jgi:hypothetical protein
VRCAERGGGGEGGVGRGRDGDGDEEPRVDFCTRPFPSLSLRKHTHTRATPPLRLPTLPTPQNFVPMHAAQSRPESRLRRSAVTSVTKDES